MTMSDDVKNPNEIRDTLPGDLDITGFVGPYQFPDNSRRRIPAVIYLHSPVYAESYGSLRARVIRPS